MQEVTNDSKNKFRILIITQGNDPLPKAFENFCNSQPLEIAGRPVEAEELVGPTTRPNALESYLATFHSKMEEFDAAIAFYTPDPRPASEAGNRNLEVGLWIGYKGDHRIVLVCCGDAFPPEGFGRLKYKPVTNEADAFECLRNQIESLC